MRWVREQRLQVLEAAADSPARQEVRAVLQAYRKLLPGVLDCAREDAAVPAALDREAAATAFIGLIQGLVMQTMLGGRPAAMRQQAQSVVMRSGPMAPTRVTVVQASEGRLAPALFGVGPVEARRSDLVGPTIAGRGGPARLAATPNVVFS